METIHLLLSINQNYLPGAMVTLSSAIEANRGQDTFHVHIFDTDIGDEGKRGLTRIANARPNVQIDFLPIARNTFPDVRPDYGKSISAYARLLCGRLPVPRAIYIDSDVLVLRNLRELWQMDLAGNIMLATQDFETPDGNVNRLHNDCPFASQEEVADYAYYNTGIVLLDLDKWRQEQLEAEAFRLMELEPQKLKAWDQTVLNYMLRGRIGTLDRNWLKAALWEPFAPDANIHYTSRKKPWNRRKFGAARQLWWMHYEILVKPFYRFRCPAKDSVYNALWTLVSTFFAFFFTEAYIRSKPTEWARRATRRDIRHYRDSLLRGLDQQSQETVKALEQQWRCSALGLAQALGVRP